MEYKVLKYLVDTPCRVVKCADIAESVKAPLSEVEAAVLRLSAAGYDIQRSGAGVRLGNLTDVLDKNSIRLMLEYHGLEEDVVFSRTTGSTNADAKLLAQSGFTGIVACETQVAGRGRRGRRFQSDRGGVYFSYVKKPSRMTADDMQRVVLLIGVGICDALEDFGVRALLKWPNDVYVGDRKISGILCEMLAEDSRVSSLILGVGINVNNRQFDNSIADIATSIYRETGRENLRSEVIASVVEHVLAYRVSQEGYGGVLARYRELSNTVGREIYVIEDKVKTKARAVEIDESGFLIVENETGRRRIVSADVTIRGC